MAKEAGKRSCTGCHDSVVMVQPGDKRKFRADNLKLRFCDNCRRSEVLSNLHGRKVKRTLGESMNRLVQYNEASSPGWRAGYLVNLGLRAASIQPIGGKNGICPSIIRVALADIKAEALQSATMPTVEDYYKMTDKKRVPVLVVQSRIGAAVVAAAITRSPLMTTADGGSFLDVREADKFTEPPVNEAPTVVRASKHAPFNAEEAVRLYQTGLPMSAVVEAVRGTRAAGGTGNLVRAALRAAGVYKEPVK